MHKLVAVLSGATRALNKTPLLGIAAIKICRGVATLPNGSVTGILIKPTLPAGGASTLLPTG
eukprot:3529469-Pleurochrysis_carterae.AAC.1